MANTTKTKYVLSTTINSVTLTEGEFAFITGTTDFDEVDF